MKNSKVSKQLSISSWNVNGLIKRLNGTRQCKLDEPLFCEKLFSDIIFLSETHLSNSDSIAYKGYKYYANCRSDGPSRLRGGLGVLIRQSLVKGITIVDKSSSESIWLKLSRTFFGFRKDIYLCLL